MTGNSGFIPIEQYRHLIERQPYGFSLKTNINFDFVVFGFKNYKMLIRISNFIIHIFDFPFSYKNINTFLEKSKEKIAPYTGNFLKYLKPSKVCFFKTR